MSFNKAEKIYSALVALQNELEETLLNNCQKVLKELMDNEKVALLNKIHRLVEEEWEHEENAQILKYRCDTCSQHFPIIKTEVESAMSYSNEVYTNEAQTSYFEPGDTSNMNPRTFIPAQNALLSTEEGMENESMEFFKSQSLIFDTLEQELPFSAISCSQNTITDNMMNSYPTQTLDHSHGSSETPILSVPVPTSSVSTTTCPFNRNSKNRNTVSSVPRRSTESKGNASSSSATLSSTANHKNVSKITSERSYLKHRSQSRVRASRISCSHCGIMVATTWTLKRHMRRIHKIDESNFRCSICARPYTSQVNLNRHLKHCRRAHTDDPQQKTQENGYDLQ